MRLPLWAQAAIAGVLVLALLILAWNFDPFGRRKRAEQKAAVATQDAAQKGEAIKQADRYHTQTVVIRDRAREAEDVVREAPGADVALDTAFRDALCSQLAGMRHGSPACVNYP